MKKRFKPLVDITAYELAMIFGNITTGALGQPPLKAEIIFDPRQWDELPETIKRHFVSVVEER